MSHNPTIEPTSINPTSSVAEATGEESPQDFIDRIFAMANTPKKAIFDIGTKILATAGHDEATARSFLGKQISEFGEGRTLSGLVVCEIMQPLDPLSYLAGCLKRTGQEIPPDWEPNQKQISTVLASGVSMEVMRDSRDVFVMFYREKGVACDDWGGMFLRWCERAQMYADNRALKEKIRLAESAGMTVK